MYGYLQGQINIESHFKKNNEKKISWEIEIPFDEYPDQVKNIYQKNYINLRKRLC